MQALLDIILPVFVVIGLGYAVTWAKLLGQSTLDGLVQFTQTIAIPCLLFRAISQIDLAGTINAPLIISYYLGAFASFAAGFSGAKLLFARSTTDAVAIGFCCLFSNTILLGIPITERAYGAGALADNFAIIAFHAPLCYLVGVAAMELARSGPSSAFQKTAHVFNAMFRNPFVIAIGLGLIVNVTELPLPVPLTSGLDLLATAALPAALFGLGGILYQYRPEGDTRTIIMICAISLIVHPTIVYATGQALSLDRDALRSAVLTAAMAPGVNTYLFANIYGAARRVAASSVLFATAASTLTILLWLMILP
ncbi:MAG: AEC family transporter [Pseudomonadota bacterium]